MVRAASVQIAVVLLAQPAPSAIAATAGVQFDGTITATCSLVVISNGTLTPSTNLLSLSSKNAGGVPGAVTLNTTGGVQVSLDALPVGTKPASDTSATTWVQTYSSSGTHTIGETSNSTSIGTPGSSTLTVHLQGTKTLPNTFSAGTYTNIVTVRCE